MTSFAIALLIGIISAVIAAPVTTRDESQYGELNVAAKLENILILIALPSKTPSLSIDNGDLESYLSLIGDRGHSTSSHGHSTPAETTNPDPDYAGPSKGDHHQQDDDDHNDDLFSADEELVDAVHEMVSAEEKPAAAVAAVESDDVKKPMVPKGRNLWGQVEDVVDNRQGASLKKELSWGQDGDGTSRSSDHNEVGLIPDRHLTLLGAGIEDCGPDRHRNSYGICTSLPSE